MTAQREVTELGRRSDPGAVKRTLNPANMVPTILRNTFAWLLLPVMWIFTGPAHAFVYPEHRDIAIWAVENLGPGTSGGRIGYLPPSPLPGPAKPVSVPGRCCALRK